MTRLSCRFSTETESETYTSAESGRGDDDGDAYGDGPNARIVGRFNPLIRTYIYPPDISSGRRYLYLLLAVLGGFLWWLGPVMGLFVADPMIQLMLLESQVILPTSDCYNPLLPNQTCSTDVNVAYYFWNITNKEEWIHGLSPPQYQEVGPFSFRAKEVRYNIKFDSNWNEVEYTFHQWAEFMPASSCAQCTMAANITSINRGYLQFLSSPSPVDPETAVIYQTMPMTLSIVMGITTSIIAQVEPNSTTVAFDAVRQWTDCSFLLPFQTSLSLQQPYLKDVPLPPGAPPLLYNLELCSYIPSVVLKQMGATVSPSQFSAYGLDMNYTATSTFLSLAIGESNATYLDPAASSFIQAFLTMPQPTLISTISTINPAAAADLRLLSQSQWLLLQGYLTSLVNTWGATVVFDYLQGNGGGLVVTKNINEWLYGYEDPLLLAAAQAESKLYYLSPWLYTPSLALTFPTEDYPVKYFEAVTGIPYNFSMLSFNFSEIGHFNPLIQQKRMQTGKAQGTMPMDMVQYKGLPFNNKTWGILNVTGIAEGTAFGIHVDPGQSQIEWDSALSRPLSLAYTGYTELLNQASTLVYNLTEASIEACNWSYYEDWVQATKFNHSAYSKAFNSISSTSMFWTLMENDTELSAFLEQGPLRSNLSEYYATVDIARDRCANPEIFRGTWDMSSTFACPTIYTFPHFLAASQDVLNTTGLQQWAPNSLQHGYSLSVDPLTGVSIGGHKTYQINHLVSQTTVIYPHLWVLPNSSTMLTGNPAAKNFVTMPTYWVAMTWEPTSSITSMIGTISRLNDALYYLLVAGCPVLGWVLLGPSLFFLRFGKLARRRARALPRIQRSQKQLGLTMAAPGNTSDTFITIDLPEDGTNIGSDVGNLTKPHDKEEEEENSYNHTNTNIGGPYTIAVRAHGSLASEATINSDQPSPNARPFNGHLALNNQNNEELHISSDSLPKADGPAWEVFLRRY